MENNEDLQETITELVAQEREIPNSWVVAYESSEEENKKYVIPEPQIKQWMAANQNDFEEFSLFASDTERESQRFSSLFDSVLLAPTPAFTAEGNFTLLAKPSQKDTPKYSENMGG